MSTRKTKRQCGGGFQKGIKEVETKKVNWIESEYNLQQLMEKVKCGCLAELTITDQIQEVTKSGWTCRELTSKPKQSQLFRVNQLRCLTNTIRALPILPRIFKMHLLFSCYFRLAQIMWIGESTSAADVDLRVSAYFFPAKVPHISGWCRISSSFSGPSFSRECPRFAPANYRGCIMTESLNKNFASFNLLKCE